MIHDATLFLAEFIRSEQDDYMRYHMIATSVKNDAVRVIVDDIWNTELDVWCLGCTWVLTRYRIYGSVVKISHQTWDFTKRVINQHRTEYQLHESGWIAGPYDKNGDA